VGLAGIAPKDELEGMMAAQLIAAHSAAMECFRRASTQVGIFRASSLSTVCNCVSNSHFRMTFRVTYSSTYKPD
jgi:hypothetical protein